MADTNDDATNALIAAMLAEEMEGNNNYTEAYAPASDGTDDSDYEKAPRKKAKKGEV